MIKLKMTTTDGDTSEKKGQEGATAAEPASSILSTYSWGFSTRTRAAAARSAHAIAAAFAESSEDAMGSSDGADGDSDGGGGFGKSSVSSSGAASGGRNYLPRGAKSNPGAQVGNSSSTGRSAASGSHSPPQSSTQEGKSRSNSTDESPQINYSLPPAAMARELEVAACTLSTVNSLEYEQALWKDSNHLYETFVFPTSFPWWWPGMGVRKSGDNAADPKLQAATAGGTSHESAHFTRSTYASLPWLTSSSSSSPSTLMLPTIPRDVDDLQGILYAQDLDDYLLQSAMGGIPFSTGDSSSTCTTGFPTNFTSLGTTGNSLESRQEDHHASRGSTPIKENETDGSAPSLPQGLGGASSAGLQEQEISGQVPTSGKPQAEKSWRSCRPKPRKTELNPTLSVSMSINPKRKTMFFTQPRHPTGPSTSALMVVSPHGVGFGFGRYETGRKRRAGGSSAARPPPSTVTDNTGGSLKGESARPNQGAPLAAGSRSSNNEKVTANTRKACPVYSSPCGGYVRAATRRSDAPGIMELHVALLATPRPFLDKLCNSLQDADGTTSELRESAKVSCTGNVAEMNTTEKVRSLVLVQKMQHDRRTRTRVLTLRDAAVRDAFFQRCLEQEELAEKLEATSCLPWRWWDDSLFNRQRPPPPPPAPPWSGAKPVDREAVDTEEYSSNSPDEDGFMSWKHHHESRKRDINSHYWQQTKRYRISVRVHGVSSRPTIFPKEASETQGKGDDTLKGSCAGGRQTSVSGLDDPADLTHAQSKAQETLQSRKRKRPRLATACFPPAVQVGELILPDEDCPIKSAYLGSYDCRWAAAQHQALHSSPAIAESSESRNTSSPLAHSSGSAHTKRIHVGRTRLIWTSMEARKGSSKSSGSGASSAGANSSAHGGEKGATGAAGAVSSAPHQRWVHKSSLTCKKFEGMGYRRPREVTVGVRVGGEFVPRDDSDEEESEDVEDRQQGELTYVRRRAAVRAHRRLARRIKVEKGSSKRADETSVNEDEGLGSYGRYNWSNAYCTLDRKTYVNAALRNARRRIPGSSGAASASTKSRHSHGTRQAQSNGQDQPINNTNTSSVAPPQAQGAVDCPSSTLSSTLGYVPMKYGATHVLKYTPPLMEFLSIDDGPLRVYCLMPGSMQRSSIHGLLNQVAKQRIRKKEAFAPLCTVCWSDDGSIDKTGKTSPVRECIDCGLPAHVTCCSDPGEFLSEDSFSPAEADASMKIVGAQTGALFPSSQSDGPIMRLQATDSCEWRCAVCADCNRSSFSPNNASKTYPGSTMPSGQDSPAVIGQKKSRRKTKPPAWFATGQEWELGNNSISTRNTKQTNKHRPNHKCAFCPHTGGAMSPLETCDSDLKDGKTSATTGRARKTWVHEICRIWYGSTGLCHPTTNDVPQADCHNLKTPLRTCCAICGMGEAHTEEKSQEEGAVMGSDDPNGVGEKEDLNSFSANGENAVGLVKCAARGCHVSFHPLCATLINKLRSEDDTSTGIPGAKRLDDPNEKKNKRPEDDLKKIDAFLCGQYTLKLLRVSRCEGGFGNFAGKDANSVVPVAFCGWHNPERERSLLGCPPPGHAFFSSMHIPPQMHPD